MMRNITQMGCTLALSGLVLSACASAAAPAPGPELTDVTFMLDWVPNTNHSGLFLAQSNGHFEEQGLRVEIIQPGEVYAEQAVASGAADFGTSFQEQLTLAVADGIPLVSVAAILQHNTSGFASPASLDIRSPADWEGLRYGSFGSPFEAPTLKALMTCSDGDFGRLEVIETGFTDPLALLSQGQIDLAWVFYGWQGIQAEQRGIDLHILMMEDYADCIPDYYTPIVITRQALIEDRPDIVRSFVHAVARGYADAIDDPDQATAALLQAAPELDAALVQASQAWISPRYQAEARRWGEQSPEVWQAYADWMTAQGILSKPVDMQPAFTNEFLP
jgi:ABC-type nitrate/sulfonate/bicarbonate transport system substrate-binding protein